MQVRAFTLDALDAIIDIHVESWRQNYRGILSDDFLDNDLHKALCDRWSGTDINAKGFVLIADTGGHIAGFIAVWTDQEMPAIYNLHVRSGHQGQGIGKTLLRQAIKRLKEQQYNSCYLYVLESNTGARRLYKSLGGSESMPFATDLFGEAVTSIRVDWPDITRF